MEEINLVATKRHGLDLIEVALYVRLIITLKIHSNTGLHQETEKISNNLTLHVRN